MALCNFIAGITTPDCPTCGSGPCSRPFQVNWKARAEAAEANLAESELACAELEQAAKDLDLRIEELEANLARAREIMKPFADAADELET